MLLSKIMLKDTRSASAMLLSALLYGPAIGPVHVRFRSWELQPLRRSRYYVIGFDRIKTLNAVSRTGRYKLCLSAITPAPIMFVIMFSVYQAASFFIASLCKGMYSSPLTQR